MIGKILTVLLAVPLGLCMVVAVSALYAWPVQLLWNYLGANMFPLVAAFGFDKYAPYHITFYQAWAMSLLCGLLFKSSK